MQWINDVIEILLGLAIFPVIAVFIYTATANSSVAQIPGMVIILPLIGLAIGFGLVYKGISGFMKKK